MKKRIWALLVCLCAAIYCWPMSAEEAKTKGVMCDVCLARDEAKSRYLPLITKSIRSDDGNVASAVLVGCHQAITNFHVLTPNAITSEKDEKGELKEIEIDGLTTALDALAFNSVNGNGLAPVKFAEGVEVGETLVSWSNASGIDGFFKTYRVAKGEDKFRNFLLSTPPIKGESGSGLFNLKGELVGIMFADASTTGGDRLYGMAISASAIKKFAEAMFKGEPGCVQPTPAPTEVPSP